MNPAAPSSADALGTTAAGLEATLLAFVTELRTAGVPVSIAESLDALEVVGLVGIGDRPSFKAALAATLVKNHAHHGAFDTAFEVFFASTPFERIGDDRDELAEALAGAESAGGAGGAGDGDVDDLVEALFQALLAGDEGRVRGLARLAVTRNAGMESGRPVGGTYYIYRTLRAVEPEKIMERLLAQMREAAHEEGENLSALEERMLREEFEARLEAFREEVRSEIRRALVDDRGAEAMAKTLRKPLLEEVDFMHATSAEMKELQRAVRPLARRLAVRLQRKRMHRRRGRLDVRRTMRESLSSGGVPLDPKFRHARPHKPEIFLLCDISGSVASFARFTLQLVYAMQSQFSQVRSFVFIDDCDEVTDLFDTDDLGDALARINSEANVVWIDGHSDYGHAFARFDEQYGDSVSSKTSLIVTGDARNNYHASEAAVIADLAHRARHVYWLNPEPISYWDTGDSIVSEYGAHIDGVFEVRNLTQLERFVEALVD
ncbi:MAG: VWA domain-containing protein [Acidimicrobiia bacterium]|nr:VWA domain-containing protein [Acidimicrobiia bacterium]